VAGEARRERLLEVLRGRETATVDELAECLDVSRMTVHRDLDLLAEHKIVRRIRGGATLQRSLVYESDYGYRGRLCLDEKRALARQAATLVEPGMAVFLDDSTTSAQLVPFLLDRRPLTVITYAMQVMEQLHKVEDVTLLALGGRYEPLVNGYVGIVCEQAIAALRADLAILSSGAVSGGAAYLHYQEVVSTKRAMMAAADRSVLLVDHTKFGKSALYRFAPLADFDVVLTNSELDAQTQALLRDQRVNLRVAEEGLVQPNQPTLSVQ